MKKSQAAMEFLMTYGWALLVIIAALAALAYFGVLDLSFWFNRDNETICYPNCLNNTNNISLGNMGIFASSYDSINDMPEGARFCLQEYVEPTCKWVQVNSKDYVRQCIQILEYRLNCYNVTKSKYNFTFIAGNFTSITDAFSVRDNNESEYAKIVWDEGRYEGNFTVYLSNSCYKTKCLEDFSQCFRCIME